MEARLFRGALYLATMLSLGSVTTGEKVATAAGAKSDNFLVTARDPEFAKQVAQQAEVYRRELAIYWLGRELPNWPDPCPIFVQDGPVGAGGETQFTLVEGTVRDWNMRIQGTRERVLDSVLPHEITHTIFATHFAPLGKPVPRWADEGACTTVEHRSERSKHDRLLIDFLHTGRGISFNNMYQMREYPQDILPLYSQGYSVSSFLVGQGGPRKFIEYVGQGMKTENWSALTQQYYGYEGIGHLKRNWLNWVADGGGSVDKYVANPVIAPNNDIQLASTSQPLAGSQPNNRAGLATGNSGWYRLQLEQNASTASSIAATAPLPTTGYPGVEPGPTVRGQNDPSLGTYNTSPQSSAYTAGLATADSASMPSYGAHLTARGDSATGNARPAYDQPGQIGSPSPFPTASPTGYGQILR